MIIDGELKEGSTIVIFLVMEKLNTDLAKLLDNAKEIELTE